MPDQTTSQPGIELNSVSDDLSAYQPPPNTYDEFRDTDGVRPKWSLLVDSINSFSVETRSKLWERADEFVHDNGVTYNVFQGDESASRPWEMDLFPFVFSRDEWASIQRGVTQRTQLLNAIVNDIYGSQSLIRSGLVPPEIVFANPGYHRAFHDLPRSTASTIALCGYEIARSPKGRWYAMADRFDAPMGAGYVLENRLAIARTLPHVIQRAEVQRLAPFFARLRKTLRSLAFRNVDDPRVVILTAGPDKAGYFEDVFLARYLGFLLVEGGDLAVRDDDVFVKTVDGFLTVDVIMSRVPEAEIDPLEVAGFSTGGVAGLLNAVRQKRVALANAPGAGLVESPVWMPFLPGICREVLGEELILPSIATWWCGTPKEREYVLSRLDELVIKPAFDHSGGREDVPEQLSKRQRQDLVAEIRERPYMFVGQEKIVRSTAPTWERNGFGSGYHALRTFVTTKPTAEENGQPAYRVLPGALVRVAPDAGPMPLSISAGTRSKDAWVLSEGPVEPLTLMTDETRRPVPRRNAHLVPCRVADNLFWLGRTLNTVEFDCRLLRVTLDRIESDRPTAEIPEFPSLVRGLVGCDLLDNKYIAGDLIEHLSFIEPAISATIFSDQNPATVRSSISELNRITGNSRDRLSIDTWQSVRLIEESFDWSSWEQHPGASDCIDFLNELLGRLASCVGLIADGMVHGAGWRFSKIGRLIGRAERTVKFLRHAWPQDELDESTVLDTLLEVMDGRITYRSRYLADIHPLLVLDLLLFDDTNPRSLAYQLSELQIEVDLLPRSPSTVGLTDVQTAILRASSELKLVDPASFFSSINDSERDGDVSPDGVAKENDGDAAKPADLTLPIERLFALLDRQEEHLKQISSALTRIYLVLSRGAKQREDGPVRLS